MGTGHSRLGRASLILGLVAAGCSGVMLEGRIYSLAEGIVLPMEIERSRGHGQIRASHPRTRETFQGTYSGVAGGAVAAGFAGTSSATAIARRTDVPAIATMIGDRGTMLDCEMLIQAGLRPHGFGTCTDNEGRQYRLHF